jgi:adrenodoxin-NADP+ reductase
LSRRWNGTKIETQPQTLGILWQDWVGFQHRIGHTRNKPKNETMTALRSPPFFLSISFRLHRICPPTTSFSSFRFQSSKANSLCYRIAVVGSGPSGFYTVKYLMKSVNASHGFRIDILERLPTPFGLVRSGVAPDHPEVKNAQNDFTALMSEDHISFFGNVNVGEDISLEELRKAYDVVVLAYGCQSDRKLGIPGEDNLSGVLSAREFVAWYNGHPDFTHIGDIVSKAFRNSPEQANVVVIGHGNVALDCARILAKGSPGLFSTDLISRALPVLLNGVKSTTVVGRRGHIQAAFTIKELRELIKLDEEGHRTTFVVSQEELESATTQSSIKELELPSYRSKIRINQLLRNVATNLNETNPKTISLRFLLNPVRFEPNVENKKELSALICERTKLEGEPGNQYARGTGEMVRIPAQLALVSVGYKGLPIAGLDPQWFDAQRGQVSHVHGKVDDAKGLLGGLYVSGWLKRGPTGIIGTNISDARDTVNTITFDLEQQPPKGSNFCLSSTLQDRNVRVVNWESYNRINAFEIDPNRKRCFNQPREKIPTYEELLKVAFGAE